MVQAVDGVEVSWNQRRLAAVFFLLGAPMGIPLLLASPYLVIRALETVASGRYSLVSLLFAAAVGGVMALIPVAFTIGGVIGIINEHVVRVTATTIEGSSRPLPLGTRRVVRSEVVEVSVVDRGGVDDASSYRITVRLGDGTRVWLASTGSNRKRADFVAAWLRSTLWGWPGSFTQLDGR